MDPVETTSRKAEDLKRKLRNARQRALFWSGNPTFTGKRFNVRRSRGDEGYELAMCDIRNLCDHIEALTGKRPKQSDPKGDFRGKFSKVMSAISLSNRSR